jgi:hypothetical protein
LRNIASNLFLKSGTEEENSSSSFSSMEIINARIESERRKGGSEEKSP